MPKTLIIAEAGVNHNGSLDMAIQLVKAAHECGADYVKFQTFKADKLLTATTEKAAYQKVTTDGHESQYEMIKRLELSEEHYLVLLDLCKELGIGFMSTPFDIDSLHFLTQECEMDFIKIPSGEITNALLLLEVARTGKKIILSTGMSSLSEVEQALMVIAFGYVGAGKGPSLDEFEKAYASAAGQAALSQNVTLLHCTTEYPAPLQDVNLRAMGTLKSAFGLPIGYSDHTDGITIPIAAVARGAVVIEKHFTLDRSLPGPDHRSSLEPGEFKSMVQAIRDVEISLGSPLKMATPKEVDNRAVVRKSIVAARTIHKGETYSPDNLTIKRSGKGISPMEYWSLLGKQANRDYEKDQIIER